MSNLKPCPFCGSGNLVYNSQSGAKPGRFVQCKDCDAHGPTVYNDSLAKREWNVLPRLRETVALPRDANGVVIKAGDVLYGLADTPAKPYQDVSIKEMIIAEDGKWRVNGMCTDGRLLTITKEWSTHEKPDIWESIEDYIYYLVRAECSENPQAEVKAIMERIKKLKESE